MPKQSEVRKYCETRLAAHRAKRYSWLIHWRDLAKYFLPRRYKWLISPNQMNRGAPVNEAILDSSGTIFARNLAAGLVSGKSSPISLWFKLSIGYFDSTGTTPVSLWLAEVERILYMIFQESNFYNAISTFYFDMVIFGTAAIIINEDHENVICCYNPALGEFYAEVDERNVSTIFYREYTKTIEAVVAEFGYENCSEATRRAYDEPRGAGRSREIVVAHGIEPNKGQFGISKRFAFAEVYWEVDAAEGDILRRSGLYEQNAIIGRWDVLSNDPYGRSPAMDGLGDQKQIQLEQRRKAQAIDKMVNPPLVADVQLKHQAANLTPGGITYVSGYAASGKPGFSSVYDTKFPVQEITVDLAEAKSRLSQIFYNDVLRVASQYETRSNVTGIEWDLRKSESLIMLSPALERIDNEVLRPIVDRVFNVAWRAGILPPPPPEIQGQMMNIGFVSMLAIAQRAARAGSIERVLSKVGELVGVSPEVMDTIDIDRAINIYSGLLNNDPQVMRSADAVAAIRQDRARQQAAAQQAAIAQQLSQGAKNLAGADVGNSNALEAMLGGV